MNKGFNENKYLCVETGSLKLKGHVLYCISCEDISVWRDSFSLELTEEEEVPPQKLQSFPSFSRQ